MSSILFLGYGSNSFSKLNTVSFLFDSGKEKMLVDCGGAVLYNIHALIPNLCDVRYCYISHSHFDHFLGLPYFIIGRNLDAIAQKKKDPDFQAPDLTIFIESQLKELLLQMLSTCHPDVKKLSFNLHFIDLCDSLFFEADSFSIQAFKVDHTVNTYALALFEGEEKILAYSSDTLYNDKLIGFLRGAKNLVLEGMVPDEQQSFSINAKHATFTDAITVHNELNAGKSFIVHLQPRYYSQIESIEKMFKEYGNIGFPNTGEWYELCV